jgi:hypothetical protein
MSIILTMAFPIIINCGPTLVGQCRKASALSDAKSMFYELRIQSINARQQRIDELFDSICNYRVNFVLVVVSP